MKLTTAQNDRAAGVLLGQACGDALGVPYEFGRPPGPDELARMTGGSATSSRGSGATTPPWPWRLPTDWQVVSRCSFRDGRRGALLNARLALAPQPP